jgi:hypothetical protein
VPIDARRVEELNVVAVGDPEGVADLIVPSILTDSQRLASVREWLAELAPAEDGLAMATEVAESVARLGHGDPRVWLDIANLRTQHGVRVIALASVASRVKVAKELSALIRKLRTYGIAFETPVAPAEVAMRPVARIDGRPPDMLSSHLAPTAEHLRKHQKRLLAVDDDALFAPVARALEFSVASAVYGRLPSGWPNRLSHVFAFHPWRASGPSGGVLVTGDASFEDSSMSADWELVVQRTGLIDLPHHGGVWGKFGLALERCLDGLPRRRRLDLYLSCAGSSKSHPSPRVLQLLKNLEGAGHVPYLWTANTPNASLPLTAEPVGDVAAVEFVLEPGWPALRSTPWTWGSRPPRPPYFDRWRCTTVAAGVREPT